MTAVRPYVSATHCNAIRDISTGRERPVDGAGQCKIADDYVRRFPYSNFPHPFHPQMLKLAPHLRQRFPFCYRLGVKRLSALHVQLRCPNPVLLIKPVRSKCHPIIRRVAHLCQHSGWQAEQSAASHTDQRLPCPWISRSNSTAERQQSKGVIACG
jgi:hypothetical protein